MRRSSVLLSQLRVPILLCCLQGRTREEAAEALGCSAAAVKDRLETVRDLLRRRLPGRGVQKSGSNRPSPTSIKQERP